MRVDQRKRFGVTGLANKMRQQAAASTAAVKRAHAHTVLVLLSRLASKCPRSTFCLYSFDPVGFTAGLNPQRDKNNNTITKRFKIKMKFFELIIDYH